jgi:uncharacterized membrane protein YhiD involved in acid resistance
MEGNMKKIMVLKLALSVSCMATLAYGQISGLGFLGGGTLLQQHPNLIGTGVFLWPIRRMGLQ